MSHRLRWAINCGPGISCMKGKYFVDTNIFVYANDPSDKIKQRIAQDLILTGIRKELIIVSAQVLSEFYVTITKKIEKTLSPEAALTQIKLLNHLQIVEIDYDLLVQAIHISQRNNISYWDALIISAAVKVKVKVLYSEDLNHGQIIENVQIINPFR